MTSGVRSSDLQRHRALGNYFFQMARTQRVGCIPTSAYQHHFQREVQSLEHVAKLTCHYHLGYRTHLGIVRHGLMRQQRLRQAALP